jgi:replicative DNA helicase
MSTGAAAGTTVTSKLHRCAALVVVAASTKLWTKSTPMATLASITMQLRQTAVHSTLLTLWLEIFAALARTSSSSLNRTVIVTKLTRMLSRLILILARTRMA